MITLIMSSSSLSTVIKEERSGFKNNTGVIFDDRYTFDFNYRRNLSFNRSEISRFKNNRGVTGAGAPPPDDLRFSNTTGILKKRKTMWFIGVEVEQETKSWIRPCVTFCLSHNKAKTPVNTRIRERGIGVQSWLCDKMWASLPADFALIIGKI